MKITKSELKTLIQEEVKRQKTVIELKNRKKAILKQLNEMDYSMEEMSILSDDELGEGKVGDFIKKTVGIKSPEQKREEALNNITKHPSYSKTPAFVAKQYQENQDAVLQKLVDFVVSNNGQFPTGGVMWDNAKKVFVDKTKYTGNAPGMQGAA